MIHLPKARTPQFAALAATGVFALALSGCGTTDDPSADATSTSQAVSEECAADTTTTSTGPVSLTDSQGRTLELDEPAKRVVVLEESRKTQATIDSAQDLRTNEKFFEIKDALGEIKRAVERTNEKLERKP